MVSCSMCYAKDGKREYLSFIICARCLNKKPLFRWLLLRHLEQGKKKTLKELKKNDT